MLRKTKLKGILSGILMLSVLCGIGVAWAWNMHRVSVDNVLNSRTVDVSIEEKFDPPTVLSGTVPKEVDFTNKGTDSVFVRFAYAEYWETATELLEGYTDTDSIIKNWDASFERHWTDGNDGWYYYNQVLPAGRTVDNVLQSVTFGDNIPNEATYTLVFQVETVQVSDEKSVNADATKLLFGIEGTVIDATIHNGAVTSGGVSWNVPIVQAMNSFAGGNLPSETMEEPATTAADDVGSQEIVVTSEEVVSEP